MADITGTLRRSFDGKEYSLRLTMRDIATLQDEYGNDLGGWLTGKPPATPNFGFAIDVITLAVKRGSKVDRTEAEDVADELFTADQTLFGAVMDATFATPETTNRDDAGNAQAPTDQTQA